MGEKCVKCDLDVVASKDGTKCFDCLAVCHLSCAGVLKRNKKWKCDNCALESASNSSKSEAEPPSTAVLLEVLTAFRKESNDRWDGFSTKIEEVRSEMRDVKCEVINLKTQIDSVKQECDSACESVEGLKVENKRLSEELSCVKQQVLDLEQHTRKNNLLITGVPLTPKENLYKLLGTLADVLNINFNNYEISTAHRLPGKKEDQRPPSIVVCFVSRDTKAYWLDARRKKGTLSARELVRAFPDSPVYLNEHLTPQTRAIFNGARQLVKQRRLSSVWTSDCRVMAKLTPDHRPFRVRDLQHVAQLESAPPLTFAEVIASPAQPTANTNNASASPTSN